MLHQQCRGCGEWLVENPTTSEWGSAHVVPRKCRCQRIEDALARIEKRLDDIERRERVAEIGEKAGEVKVSEPVAEDIAAYKHGWKYRAEFDERRKMGIAYTDPAKQAAFVRGVSDCEEAILQGVVPETTPRLTA